MYMEFIYAHIRHNFFSSWLRGEVELIFFEFAHTGGSCLSRTAVKPDSRLAQIFCIISFLYNLINLMQITTDKPDNW